MHTLSELRARVHVVDLYSAPNKRPPASPHNKRLTFVYVFNVQERRRRMTTEQRLYYKWALIMACNIWHANKTHSLLLHRTPAHEVCLYEH